MKPTPVTRRSSRRTRRAFATLMVTCAAASALAAATDPATSFHANPEVRVVHVTPTVQTGTLQLVNNSAAQVTVQSIARDPSCDAQVTHTIGMLPLDIPPDTAATVTIHCATAVTSGMKRCIFHAIPPTGPALLDFEGVCEGGTMPSLGVDMPAIDFGTVMVGNGSSGVVQLANASPTTITQLYFQTTDIDGNFEIGAPCNPDARQCDAMISGLGNGSAEPFTVWCRPKTAGTHTAVLHVSTNTNQYLMTPIVLVCIGEGTSSPVFSITGDPVDAGSAEVLGGSVIPVPVRVRNGGGGTLTISSVQIVDGGNGAAADWSYLASGDCAGTIASGCDLAANQEVALNLTFDPSVIGSRDATLVIGYNDGIAHLRSVALDGIGLGATLELVGAPVMLDFGVVPVAVLSTLNFQLANQGNRSTTAMLSATPAGIPFSLTPPSSVQVGTTMPAMVTAGCRPTSAGMFTTTFHAMANDTFMSPPISIMARCEGTTMPLYGDPTSLALGEIRTGTPTTMFPIEVLSASAQLQITNITLEADNTNLSVTASVPATTPVTFQLVVQPTTDGTLMNAVNVSASNGNTLRIPISGSVATADYTAPQPRSLGTFCVEQPTTGVPLALESIGTARIRVDAPTMDLAGTSPFDVDHIAPTVYPATLSPDDQAIIEITPKRRMTPGIVQDDVVWSTDVAGMLQARTAVTATFVDDGGAISPSALLFGPATIHLDEMNAQSVTLQNCDTQTIAFDAPDVPSPFRIDSSNFPDELAPNESATFTVGFHPTKLGEYNETLVITSPQLVEPLEVMLNGEGVRAGGEADAGTPTGFDERSFYGCSGCSTRKPAGVISSVLALMCSLVPRRRRRRCVMSEDIAV